MLQVFANQLLNTLTILNMLSKNIYNLISKISIDNF